MFYTDIHSHILAHTDDGAETEEIMYRMLDRAYAAGTRRLCATPHYMPAFYGQNKESSEKSFSLLSAYAAEKYPDMQLSLGNEMGYHTESKEALVRQECRLLGGRYLLLDFMPNVSLFTMRYAIDELFSGGYSLILAHIERYEALEGRFDLINEWVRRGALMQMDADAFSPHARFGFRRYVKQLIAHCPIHLVASDMHDLDDRAPELDRAAHMISKMYGEDEAEFLLCYAPNCILDGKKL